MKCPGCDIEMETNSECCGGDIVYDGFCSKCLEATGIEYVCRECSIVLLQEEVI